MARLPKRNRRPTLGKFLIAMRDYIKFCAIVALSTGFCLPALAIPSMDVLVATGGFENRATSPDFNLGSLTGQNNWRTTSDSDSTATVVGGVGGQAVLVEHDHRDRRWAVVTEGSAPSGRYVTITWDMAVAVTQATSVLGPFFGVEAYGADGAYSLLGSLGVDATTGQVVIQQASTGYFINAGRKVDSDWHRYTIELDYQSDQYRTYLDGALLATTHFVDDDKNELNTFSDADISALAIQATDGNGQLGIDSAVFDNFQVIDGVPGDFNADGEVSLADYTVWRDTLGATGLSPQADATGNGEVTSDDYQVWRDNFGRNNVLTAPIAPGLVPEPQGSAIVSLLIGLAIALIRGR